ncbi:MAG: hypothetical protein WBE21_08200 [Candidatus Acidiferrales bacterium]|jgi:hypothetical protein|nr:hypothetical protein [Candidatus Acidoferrales bacterium]
MRPFRRFFAFHLLLAFSFPAFAAFAQAPQPLSAQAITQSLPQSATKLPAKSQGDDPLAAAARELARKVAASVGAAIQGKLTIAPNFVNLSSLSSFEFQKACGAFHDEIEQQAQAFRAASSQDTAPASVSVTLAEDLHGFLWVAQVTQGASQQTVIVSVAREMVAQTSQPSPSVTLQKEFLLSQPEPILDADFLSASPSAALSLLILQPSRVALFAQQNGAWRLQSEAPIAHAAPWPRDIRGRLQQGADGEEAVLPGVTCNITVSSALSASCKPGNAGWLFSTAFLRAFTLLPTAAANGNTFIFPALGSQEFSSLAVIAAPPSSGAPAPVIATTPNGRALLFEGSSTPVASFPGWGSDVAVLYSTSRARWPLLVTRAGDWTVPDSIQAFDIIDRQAVAISGEINFDGPITALWSEDENSVIAVSRNLKTGMYEAYFIHVVYNQ